MTMQCTCWQHCTVNLGYAVHYDTIDMQVFQTYDKVSFVVSVPACCLGSDVCKTISKTTQTTYSASQKNPPYGFLKFFLKRLGIFNQFFTHLLYEHFYTRLQIFIQLSPI